MFKHNLYSLLFEQDKNRLIAKLKEQVQFLSELHEKGEKGYMKVSVEFQQICKLEQHGALCTSHAIATNTSVVTELQRLLG